MAAVAVLIGVGFGVHAYAAGNAASEIALASATPSNYCQQYEQALAKQLGTSTSALESANEAATKSVLDQMVKDGKITAAQEQKIEARLAAKNYQVCGPHGFGGPHARGGKLAGIATPAARSALVSAVATKLGISASTLESDLANGQTLAQIASKQNVSISDVNSAYLGAAKQLLDNAVSAKTITSARESTLYAKLQTAVNNGRYPGLERPHGPHGTPPTAPSTSPATSASN